MTSTPENNPAKTAEKKTAQFVIRAAQANDPGNPDFPVTLLWRSTSAGEMVFGRMSEELAASLLGGQNPVVTDGVDLPASDKQRELRIYKIHGNQSIDTVWMMAADDVQLRTLPDNILMRILLEDPKAFWFEEGQPDWNLRRVEQLEFEAGAATMIARMRTEEAVAARRAYQSGRVVLGAGEN